MGAMNSLIYVVFCLFLLFSASPVLSLFVSSPFFCLFWLLYFPLEPSFHACSSLMVSILRVDTKMLIGDLWDKEAGL